MTLTNCSKGTDNQENSSIEPSSLGELITIDTYDGKQVTYRNINGKNVFEDDIILTENQIEFLKHGPIEGQEFSKSKAAPGVFLNRWTNSTVNFNISFTAARSDILTAINTLESATNINFVEQASGNYIDFVNSTGNFCGRSKLGMIGGRQEIELVCTTQRTIIHEILHALGFFHEHTRPDRDNFIAVNWGNIQSEFSHNYEISISQAYGTSLDFNSIMLYSSFNGSAINSSLPTMTRISDGLPFSGGSNLSVTDANALLDMYYTPNSVQNINTSGDIIDVGANSNGDYIYVKKNRFKHELYKNGIKINSNFNSGEYGIDIANNGDILSSSTGYNNKTIDISEGNGTIFCLSQVGRRNDIYLYRKNGNSWTSVIKDNSFKRLTVDNQGNAWVLSEDKIKVFNSSGVIINTIDIAPYVSGVWERFNDIGNAGNEIYVSVRNARNSGTMLLRYSLTINEFIKQPDPQIGSFRIDKLDGSNNGTIWFSEKF
ncbi:hypothetical protein GCM10011368_22870 [Hyunsoonleella pacifica]|nr:hypothetical protein GCM10011368_22870 [Hyunsoonleella pacifica]